MNVLGVRLRSSAAAGSLVLAQDERQVAPISYLDFTVDGRSVGDRFGGDITALTAQDPDFRTESLRRLAGAQVPIPTLEARFYRTRLDRLLHRRGTLIAPCETAFDDGRVGLYFCPCGDMDCGVVSTRVEMTSHTVTWHEIGWQVAYEPFNPERDGLATFIFERESYGQLLGWLITADWSAGIPVPAAS